jgi:hypothetical protein
MALRRFYTQKSYKLMERARICIVIITSPLWLPLYLIVLLADKFESLLILADKLLQKFLDKTIPQIK